MPTEWTVSKDLIFRSIAKELQGAIVVAAHAVGLTRLTSEVPYLSSEDPIEVFAFEHKGILKDLEFVVGDEVVAEGGGVEGEGEEDEDGEMEEAGAVRNRGRGGGRRR